MIPFFKRQKGNRLLSRNFHPQDLLSQQVQWQHPALLRGDIDQTHLEIADAPTHNDAAFSFLVIGDTDAGSMLKDEDSFSQAFARQLVAHLQDSHFLIHTGDVAYPTGSYQNYFTRFLAPYKALLTQAPSSPAYTAAEIVFNKALLSVPGNHDYSCDASRGRALRTLLRQLCDRLRKTAGIDLGHYGGDHGEAYGQTFLDSLSGLSAEQLTAHLAKHYSARHIASSRQCLSYRPGHFTRLPNRYYSFRYGGVDFFALDSNTWNTASHHPGFDQTQLDWLERGLTQSWQTPNTLGRIVYLHHSPYTTEAYHWQQPETLWVRRHLRTVFNNVAIAIGREETAHEHHGMPTVDLVLSGHAHCLEHLKSSSSNIGEQGIDWVVCGGSGDEVRRQRSGSGDILESVAYGARRQTEVVARSQRFVGRHTQNHKAQNCHSFIRVNIQPQCVQKITVTPFVVHRQNRQWTTTPLTPLAIGQASEQPRKQTTATSSSAEMAQV